MIWIYVLSSILVFIILVRIYWYLDDKKKIKNILESFKSDLSRVPNKDYSQKRLKSIYGYAKRHQNDDTLDEITFEDLDILSVYKEINYSYSSVGDEYLMYTLLNPHLDKWDISDYEKKIGLIKDGGNKDKLSLSFYLLSRTGRFSLYDYIDKLDNLEKKSNIKYIILWIIYGIITGVIVFSPYLGLVLLFLYAIVVAGIYLYHKKDVSEYLLCFKYINKMVRCATEVESYLPDEYGEEKVKLKEDIKKLKFINGPLINILFKSNTNSVGDISGGLYDYLNMLTHLDMFIFNNLIGNVKANTGTIDEMFSILGSVESKISVINYRNRIDYYSKPDLDNKFDMEAVDVYHPLLDNPVSNSIKVEKKGVLITGSNASGKSTFLRTIGINALLSQSINTSLSKSYRGKFYKIMSSMTIKDDLLKGDSYYMAEIKSIRRLLDKVAMDYNVLCFVDEVLKGTNTVERIAGGYEILLSLSRGKSLCFAATHDIELTSLLENTYQNMHFEEEIKDNDIVFNYHINAGKANSRNAIRLLSLMGYDENIVNNADRIASDFLKTGEWRDVD